MLWSIITGLLHNRVEITAEARLDGFYVKLGERRFRVRDVRGKGGQSFEEAARLTCNGPGLNIVGAYYVDTWASAEAEKLYRPDRHIISPN